MSVIPRSNPSPKRRDLRGSLRAVLSHPPRPLSQNRNRVSRWQADGSHSSGLSPRPSHPPRRRASGSARRAPPAPAPEARRGRIRSRPPAVGVDGTGAHRLLCVLVSPIVELPSQLVIYRRPLTLRAMWRRSRLTGLEWRQDLPAHLLEDLGRVALAILEVQDDMMDASRAQRVEEAQNNVPTAAETEMDRFRRCVRVVVRST